MIITTQNYRLQLYPVFFAHSFLNYISLMKYNVRIAQRVCYMFHSSNLMQNSDVIWPDQPDLLCAWLVSAFNHQVKRHAGCCLDMIDGECLPQSRM